MVQHDRILIKGARQNNLKNIDLEIPRDKLVVITGLSGSGKSSLAFDTLYAEGQRRYVESLSAYARQFLGQMDKPDVDYIEGLSPAVSIDQKSTSRNPRATVGTVTDRLVVKPDAIRRIADSLETALKKGEGNAAVDIVSEGEKGRRGEGETKASDQSSVISEQSETLHPTPYTLHPAELLFSEHF